MDVMQVRDKNVPDDKVAEMIIQKLKDTSAVVSFAEIARAAWEDGRNRLAGQVCVCVCVCVCLYLCLCLYVHEHDLLF